MPIYRLNNSGMWKKLGKVYRLNNNGMWKQLSNMYRLNNSGMWKKIFSLLGTPTVTTSPTLTNQASSITNFYGGDTLTLTRGEYTNTTANSNTSYRMTIYKGLNNALALNDTNWEVASRTTFTGANSTSSTSITYSLTDTDAKLGYYLVGEVRVNNNANTTGSPTYDFETASRVLSRISFTVSGLTVTPTDRGGTFSWTVGGVADSTFIYSQTLTIRLTGPTGTIKKTVSIAPGTTTTTVSDAVNISPSTLYYAIIEVVANDGWKTTPTPNTLSDNEYFNTLSAAPINTVPPTIGPLNGRTPPSGFLGYLPVSTTLTSTTGTWINLSSPTYTYNWYREDSISGSITSNLNAGNQISYSVSDVDDFVFVQVRATNSDGSLGSANSGSYILNQAVAVGTITPTTANQNVSRTFSFNISHYPTSYVINWGDGTSDSYSVTANTSTVNASHSHTYTSSGTFTITVTAQPGSKTNTASVVVSAPLSFLFDANGGTLSSGPGNGQTSYTYTGAIGSTLTAPSATRQHYALSTWRSPLSGGTDPKFLSPGINYTIGSGELFSSTTFYAIWTANTYTVTYNYNSGTGTPASASVQYPGSVTLPTPTRTNYTFNGWYTASSGGTFVGNGGSSYTPTSNITLFAQWTIIQYTVTWNANGGSVTPTSNIVNAGSAVTAPTPTRTGYTFSTWRNPLSGGDPITVAAGGSYTPTANITFYAIWTINTYTVSYNSNGATSGTAPANQTKTHDVTLTLATNSGNLQRTGYTFDGWYTNTSGTGGTAYAVGSNYTLNQALTLYAKWNIVQYTVTWNANGGTVDPPSSTVNAGSSVTAPTPTRSGFTFSTWRNPLSGGDPIFVAAGGTYTPTANITFFAIWTQTVPGPPRTVALTRNQTTWNGTSWTWNCTWLAPNTGGTVSTYEAYREVGTGTVGNATLTTIQNTSTPQTGLTTTSTTFSTTVQAAPRADAYVRACNSGGCSSYVSGNVG